MEPVRTLSLPGVGSVPPALEVFAVEDDAVQVIWRNLGRGAWVISAGDTAREVADGVGIGAVVLDDLVANREVTVTARPADATRSRPVLRRRVRTLAPPPGDELCRFATVNDLHIGASRFGTARPLTDPPDEPVPFGDRCLTAALDESWAWGARNLVAKGDLTDRGWTDQWERLAAMLTSSRFTADAIDVVEGNHDVKAGNVVGIEPMAAVGITMHEPMGVRDLPGVRIVLVDTAIEDDHWGRIAHVADDVLDAAADGHGDGRCVFVAVHHQPQPFRVPTTWPPGIPGPEARPFLDRLDAVAPGALVATGHTHRHRRHRHRSVSIVEIGSTRDHPGTWAGYAVHEGGLRQVVRRVADPRALVWTERCRWVLGGVWGAWSPGPRAQRCFTISR